MSVTIAWIIVGIIALLLLPWVIEALRVLEWKNKAIASEYFLCSSLRHLVYITGQIGSGKTTFQAGYANVRTKDLIQRAIRRIEFTCLAFPDVPFQSIEKDLYQRFIEGEIDSFKIAKSLIATGSPFHRFAKYSYDNHRSSHPVPFVKRLANYIDARMALFRNNYVYYYAKGFYSQVTFNDARDYSPSRLNIKDIYSKANNYHLLPFSIIAEDEKQLSGKDCTQFRSYAKADTGADTCLRLIRHLGQETIFYSTTNQNFATDRKRERDLATEIVDLESRKIINPRFRSSFILKLIEIPFKKIRNHQKRREKKRLTPLLSESRCRSILSWVRYHKKKLEATSFALYKGRIYHRPEDYGKNRSSALFGVDSRRVSFPIKYCFGSVDSYKFHAVQNELISKSQWKYQSEPLAVQDADLASRVLQKRHKPTSGP